MDFVTLALLAASFFFVAISLALLIRYRQVSERINASTDLGRDLWSSLEQRLKKQDERILDMMGRVEVIQSRVVAASTAFAASAAPMPPPAPAFTPRKTSQPEAEPGTGHTQVQPTQQPQSQTSQESQPAQPVQLAPEALTGPPELDETQVAALRLLSEAPKNTRQLTDALGKSREHTARVMKELFGMGLVQRNAASKPFVYELTGEGRKNIRPAPP